MNNNIYNNSIQFYKKIIKFFSVRYSIIYSENEITPAVYIVHHQNLRGPLMSIIWLNSHMHMWVLSPFLNRKSCFSHYVNYTFTKRFGLPKVMARIIALPISYFVSWLLNAIKAIPVYRGNRDIVLSFKQSVSALVKCESLLISPDIDYTNKGSDMGEMYDGFLDIDRFYMKEVNRHISFIPLHIDKSKHSIFVGRSISFTGEGLFRDEKNAVLKKLKNEFLRIQQL